MSTLPEVLSIANGIAGSIQAYPTSEAPCHVVSPIDALLSVTTASIVWAGSSIAIAMHHQANHPEVFHQLPESRGSQEKRKRITTALASTAIAAVPSGVLLLGMIEPWGLCQ